MGRRDLRLARASCSRARTHLSIPHRTCRTRRSPSCGARMTSAAARRPPSSSRPTRGSTASASRSRGSTSAASASSRICATPWASRDRSSTRPPLLRQQPRLRDVRPHERTRHVRRRRRVRRAPPIYSGDEMMDLFVFLGEPKDVLSEYTAITGRSPVPPLWSFGLWMSRITYKAEAEVRDVAAKLRQFTHSERRAAPRHRLVRDRLAERLRVLHVALHRSARR